MLLHYKLARVARSIKGAMKNAVNSFQPPKYWVAI